MPASSALLRLCHTLAPQRAPALALTLTLALPLAAAGLLGQAAGQDLEPATPRVLRFEPPLVHSAPLGALEEQGFLMKPREGNSGLHLGAATAPASADNGGSYANVDPSGANCTITHRDGLPFTVTTVDLAEYSSSGNGIVNFYGIKPDGSIAIGTFFLDQINDGSGPLADFQTFTFPASFTRIVELKITTASYRLDNLQLTLHGTESPAPPRPQPPLVYDIDWSAPTHALNQFISLGGPRAPSSLSQDSPSVRSRVGGLRDRPAELSSPNGGMKGFYLQVGLAAGRYVLEFDTTTVGSASLEVHLNHTHGWIATQFLANMSHGFQNFADPGGPVGTNPLITLYSPQALNHVRMEFNPAGGRVEVALNGKVTGTWNLPAGAAIDLRSVRFFGQGSGQVGVDNIKLSAYERSALVVSPPSYHFGDVPVGTEKTKTFTLRNSGDTPLTVTGATSLGVDAGWQGLTFPFTIPAQGQVTAVMAVRPSAPTSYSCAERFFTSDGAAQVDWAVVGEQTGQAVQFPRQPWSLIQLTGVPANPLSLYPHVTGAVMGYQWLRNGVPIPGATTATLSIPISTPENMAGDYRLRVTQSGQMQVYSRTGRVAVVPSTATTRQAAVGSRVEATATGVGQGLHFAWRHNGRLLTGTEQGVTIAGNGTSLVLDPVQPEHQGVYIATAQMPDPHDGAIITAAAVSMTLTVPQPLRIATTVLHHWQVGRQQSFSMSPTGSGQWSAIDLPPGLQIEPNTGVVYGTVTPAATPQGVSVRYQPTFTLVDGQANANPPVTLDLWVHPAMPTATQTYVGIIQPGQVGGDSRRLGGRVKFSVTPSGSYTASLTMPLRTMTATSAAVGVLTFRPRDGVLAGRVEFASGNYSLVFQVQIDPGGHLQTEDQLGVPNAIFDAWRALPKLNPAIHQAGLFPTALLRGTPDDLASPPLRFGLDTPAGSGVLQVTLLASGRANYSGTLADGTTVTGSDPVTANVQTPAQLHLPVFVNAPANRGSVVGWLTCQGGELEGELAWQKNPGATDLGYRAGFENVPLLAVGDRQTLKPAAASHFGRMRILGSHQKLEIAPISMHPQLNSTFSVGINARVTRTSGAGQAIATLTLQPASATFRGTVDLATYRGMIVRGSYMGVFVPRLGRGFGFCHAVDSTYFNTFMNPRIHFSRSVQMTEVQPN